MRDFVPLFVERNAREALRSAAAHRAPVHSSARPAQNRERSCRVRRVEDPLAPAAAWRVSAGRVS
ncbi:hypothetical protein [Rhodococcus sp. BP-241]|uniref:hypothetical protein n=1 Tax=Rhodococcus sp. BP-241 TaxID=2739441 RepID=UPI0035AC1526